MDPNVSTKLSSADMSALKKLLLLSLAMFVFPLGTFFTLQKVLPKENVLVAVLGSIIAVHIVIALYVWMALNETGEEEAVKKD